MFEPVCQVCGDSYHGNSEDETPDEHDHMAVLEWPSCHVCGRVLTDDDHTDEAGTDGDIYWDQYLHSPDGLEEIAGALAWFEFEEARIKAESGDRLKAMIAEGVREALAGR